VKVLPVIGTSLGCSAVITAAFARYIEPHAASPAFWQHDPIGFAWKATGGMGGFFVALFATFAFILLTAGARLDLAAIRRRLDDSADHERMPESEWHGLFAGTSFEAIAGQLTFYELGVAPLSLLRVLRAEIWRVYAKRLLATQTVTVLLFVIDLVIIDFGVARVLEPLAPPFVLGVPFQAFLAIVSLILLAGTWLLMDDGIGKLAMAVTRLSSARDWRMESAGPRAIAIPGAVNSLRSIDPLLASLDRLVEELTGRMAAVPEGQSDIAPRLETALKSVETVLRDSADQQRAAIEKLSENMAAPGIVPRLETALKSVETALRDGAEQQRAALERLAEAPPAPKIGPRLETALKSFETVIRSSADQQRTASAKLSESMAAPDLAPRLEAALKSVEAMLRDSAVQQRAAIERLAASLAAQSEDHTRWMANASPPTDQEFRKLSDAIGQLTAAVDKMADPELRPPQPAYPPRPDAGAGNGGQPWNELVSALHEMSAGLEKFTQTAAHDEPDGAAPRRGKARPAALTNELQNLLDEMTNDEGAAQDDPAKPLPR
jgi:hypothetical protein